MDIYSVSFCLPRRSPSAAEPAASSSRAGDPRHRHPSTATSQDDLDASPAPSYDFQPPLQQASVRQRSASSAGGHGATDDGSMTNSTRTVNSSTSGASVRSRASHASTSSVGTALSSVHSSPGKIADAAAAAAADSVDDPSAAAKSAMRLDAAARPDDNLTPTPTKASIHASPPPSDQPGQQFAPEAEPSTSAAPGQASRQSSIDLNDAVQRVCLETMTAHQCPVSFAALDAEDNIVNAPQIATRSTDPNEPKSSMSAACRFNFHISGPQQQVLSARGDLLRETPFKKRSVVKVPRVDVLFGKDNVKPDMRLKLDEIAALTKAHLAIVGSAASSIGFGLETERVVEIVITGAYESVEQARVRLLVLLDEMSGLHSEVCEIDYKLHNIISGRRRAVLQNVQEETATNIYLPTPFSGRLGPKSESWTAKQNLIFITGDYFGVQRARDMLFQIAVHKSKCVLSRETAMLPRKIDWLLSEKLEELRGIMYDNATFINLPPLGSQASLVSVLGDHRVLIERTIRAIMQMATQYCVASFWLLPVAFDMFTPPPTINPSQVPPILRQIAVSTGAEAVFKSNCWEFHGLESEVRAAIQLALDVDFVKAFHHEIRFQVELANEHREFISGKKNGKLNKIMKSANVKIKFETFNDYNFLIDVAGSDTGALHGLSMLQEELPAEISFHVPEVYHKRIIGVGGKNIQRIMKKFGVYVKFSNAEEFAALGGYADNEDNVIARTPAKNAASLEHLKQSIMELVALKDKDWTVETVLVPRRYHRVLLGEKSIFIHDIEKKTSSTIRFPNKESASDVVSIYGPESQAHIAAQMLLDHVPFEAEYRIPHSDELDSLTLSQEFVDLTERIKRDYHVAVLPWVDRTGSSDETTLRLCLNRSNMDFLATARDLVEEFLVEHKIELYPGSTRPRSDSFANSFPFFNSRLLSSVSPDKPEERRQASEPSNSNDKAASTGSRKAVSSPDIKAIFDANRQAAPRLAEQQQPRHYQPTPFAVPAGGQHGHYMHLSQSHQPRPLPPVDERSYLAGSQQYQPQQQYQSPAGPIASPFLSSSLSHHHHAHPHHPQPQLVHNAAPPSHHDIHQQAPGSVPYSHLHQPYHAFAPLPTTQAPNVYHAVPPYHWALSRPAPFSGSASFGANSPAMSAGPVGAANPADPVHPSPPRAAGVVGTPPASPSRGSAMSGAVGDRASLSHSRNASYAPRHQSQLSHDETILKHRSSLFNLRTSVAPGSGGSSTSGGPSHGGAIGTGPGMLPSSPGGRGSSTAFQRGAGHLRGFGSGPRAQSLDLTARTKPYGSSSTNGGAGHPHYQHHHQHAQQEAAIDEVSGVFSTLDL